MTSSGRPPQKDYSGLFVGAILLGIIIVVVGIVLAFTQLRAEGLRSHDAIEQSGKARQVPGVIINGGKFISESMERIQSG